VPPGTPDQEYLLADALDARAALAAAATVVAAMEGRTPQKLREMAEVGYRWLKQRDSLRVISISLVPGTPRKEGTPVTTTFNLDDTDQVPFTLMGADAKGAQVPLPGGVTAAWSLADPDSSGATLTVAPDTLSAVVAGGVPDTNLMLTTAVTMPDGVTVLNGAEAIVVQATAAQTISLVPGTPTPETPPAVGP